MKDKFFTLRLSESERERLAALAELSGRSRAAVVKRLLDVADQPHNRQALGLDPMQPVFFDKQN